MSPSLRLSISRLFRFLVFLGNTQTAPSSTTTPAAAAPGFLPIQGQMNPAQIALAAARNLGVHSALPSTAGAQAIAGYQANPALLAQLMRPPQSAAQPQCKCLKSFRFSLGGRGERRRLFLVSAWVPVIRVSFGCCVVKAMVGVAPRPYLVSYACDLKNQSKGFLYLSFRRRHPDLVYSPPSLRCGRVYELGQLTD